MGGRLCLGLMTLPKICAKQRKKRILWEFWGCSSPGTFRLRLVSARQVAPCVMALPRWVLLTEATGWDAERQALGLGGGVRTDREDDG